MKIGERPLFVPLKTEWFEAFRDGSKDTEFRPYGPRWNEQTCRIGRAVVISKGYGRKHRLRGRVAAFVVRDDPECIPGWIACYGTRSGRVACVRIALAN